MLVAVRDAESRTRFLGYRVEHVKLFAFVVSACMAGIAGALYVPQVGIINPSEFAPANSIEVVIWIAVGGRATLVGPIIGAILVNAGKSYFTGALPDAWLFVLGGLFVAVTLFLPKGIVGTLAQGWNALGRAAPLGAGREGHVRRERRQPRSSARTSRCSSSGAGGVGHAGSEPAASPPRTGPRAAAPVAAARAADASNRSTQTTACSTSTTSPSPSTASRR